MTTRSRRHFLRTGTIAVGLPYLESLANTRRARAAESCAPGIKQRFVTWYYPNGIIMPDWTPTSTGKDWALTPTLAALARVRRKIAIVTGLENQSVANPKAPPGDHAGGTGCFLTQVPVYNNENDPTRTSLDQMIVDAIGPCTRLPSLQLGIETTGQVGSCDGATCVFSRCISWRNGTPQPNIIKPQVAFDRIFAGPQGSGPEAEARRIRRSSVLDHVGQQVTTLAGQLATPDRRKLDEYLTGIRALELRIQQVEVPAQSCGDLARPAATLSFDEHVRLNVDLIALAIECDVTRVATFMLANSQSQRSYGVPDASGGHHPLSHHGGNQDYIERLKRIDKWTLAHVARLLEKLDGMDDGGGRTVLDNTAFFFSSEISDGDRHNHWDLPVLLAGSAGGKLGIDGRHVSYTSMTFPRPRVGPQGDRTVGDLFLTIAQAFGLGMTKFGRNGTRALSELLV